MTMSKTEVRRAILMAQQWAKGYELEICERH